MKDDEVDAATHMELNNPTNYNLGLSSEEEDVQEEEIPNKFAQSMLPKDNKLVENFYYAKKCSKKISLPIKKIHACKKHCMLFYDVDASLTHCRWYGTSRYKSGGRKVPNLVLTYMPIADRLQMLYMSEKMAKDMTWQADHKTTDGRMVHPSDGRAWKNFDLEDLLFAHNLDVMHIEKNVFVNIFNTVMDTSKTKDNIKERMDIEKYCDRADLHVWKQNNKVLKTKASYTLSKPQVKKVCMIPDAIWDEITELCTFFRVLCSKELHIEDLETLKDNIVVTLCKLEKVFPPGLFDSMEHLVIHFVNEAINGGPEQYRWMYLYERKLGSLRRTIRNRARPEGYIVEAHRDLKDWWAVVKAMPRGIFQVAEGILATEISNDDNVDREEFFQENDKLNDNGEEEKFEDMNGDDDSSDDIDHDSSNHSSDDDASIPTGRGGSSIVGREREIANEWSLRGRGNNSSSGNGRDIPDECSPIGRGSNNTSGNGRGRADDYSPRGRGSNNTSGNGMGITDDISPRGRGSNNTFGNARGITDDISPRGRGSTNRDISDDCSPIGRASSSICGRGNESADEWCPSPNILSDEILDVHKDNEEHVEHVVGSSQNQVGSNVTPSSSLPKLWLVGGVFYDPAISLHVVRLFKTTFKGAYATWTKVPQDHSDRCFKRFGTFYRWEDAESNQIRDAWESHMKNMYSNIVRGVSKAVMKVTRVNDNVDIGRISSSRPIWIGAADWQPMVNVWEMSCENPKLV
nr:hypothetical protein [Tanacetum cinerariifolium]